MDEKEEASAPQPSGKQPTTESKVTLTKNQLSLKTHGAADAKPCLHDDDILFTHKYIKKFSPRSKEALRQLGILSKELIVKPFEAFYEPGTLLSVALCSWASL